MQTREPVPTYFGRYQVLEELGSGAMGVVYLCVDPRLTRPVAVKVIRESEHMTPAEKEQFLARFRQEAEAAGRLNHPGIVQIYDVGPSYLVMEYLDGKALAAVLKGGHVYTVQEVCSIVLQVSDAIDYAHKHGIVHRDIKPANIMMMDDGGVKVMDFGVARLESSTLTVVGTVVGSVRYMAPEQMMGERVDARADVFSLGAVAYEMLTGRAPFPGKTITEVVGQVVHGAYVPPRQVDDRLPEELNDVFGGVFAVSPDDRYPSAMDFARDLYAASEPVLGLHIGPDPDHPPPSEVGTTMMAPTVRLPAEAAAAREGVLLVDSEPEGAQVYLDGKPLGATPVAGIEVSFGRHVLRIEKEGREPVSAEVEVKREQPLKLLGFSLPVARAGREPLRSGQFVTFGPDVVPPVRVSGAVPDYPPAARERGMEGSPVVDIWVDEKGNVMDVAIVESAGAMLDGAVLEAVAGWKFRPATVGGTAVSVRMTL
ncbi:MAG TPA: TonB family protein, partial [Vicinamibacteria bacterium]|nr:TonB family protein [Vicinamibacteria bacterium]